MLLSFNSYPSIKIALPPFQYYVSYGCVYIYLYL